MGCFRGIWGVLWGVMLVFWGVVGVILGYYGGVFKAELSGQSLDFLDSF